MYHKYHNFAAMLLWKYLRMKSCYVFSFLANWAGRMFEEAKWHSGQCQKDSWDPYWPATQSFGQFLLLGQTPRET